jgi:hypothetical protein
MPRGIYEHKKWVLPYRGTPEERFWKRVKQGKTENDCWDWLGAKLQGYRQIRINHKSIKTHRFSYELHKGKIPKWLGVLHHCDNPPCCNPKHLFLGTHKENMADRDIKGRQKLPDVRGEKNGMAKLTKEKVEKIRELYATGKYTLQELGLMFGTNFRNVSQIINKKRWI